jgi:hypothetical protein
MAMKKLLKSSLLKGLIFLSVTFMFPVFSLAQGTWTQKSDLPGTGRFIAASFSIGTRGYIGLGYADMSMNPAFRDFYEWDQSTNIWTKKADYPGSSGGTVATFTIGTKGYIGTGQFNGGNGFTNELWEYNPATNTWTQKASLPSSPARAWAVGFSIGTKGYIGTGSQDEGLPGDYFNQDLWEWDQTTNTWTQKANFGGTARSYAIGFSIGTKGYIGAGEDVIGGVSVDKKDFWEWDQATNLWTKKADFGGTARGYANGFSIGTKGYVIMGMNASYTTMFNDVWEWDQNTNVWAQKATFGGIARFGAVGFAIGNKGYIGTGFDQTSYYHDLWEFDPSVITGNEEVTKEIILIYPNPTSGKFTIKNIEHQTTGYKLEVYNVFGNKIYSDSGVKRQTSNEIDLSNSPKGIYIVKIYYGEKNYSEKIVIQ